MDSLAYLFDVFLHLDKYLGTVINNYGFENMCFYLLLYLLKQVWL